MRSITVRRTVALAVGIAALVAAQLAATSTLPARDTVAARDSASAAYPPYPPRLTLKSELRLKANLAQKFVKPPELVFFGGSRSQRFDPAYARRVLGLRTMNFALSNGRPECAWAYVNWIYRRWPNAKLRFVWGIQPTMFQDRNLNPALLQDKRFYRYFPDDLLAAQRRSLPTTVARIPKYYAFTNCTYSNRGLLLWNLYDKKRARGYTLERSLNDYIALMFRKKTSMFRKGSLGPDTRARAYFEKTIKLLNQHGTTPIVVMMPVHPRVIRVLNQHNWLDGHLGLLDYFAELSKTLSIKVVNYYRINSFGGDPTQFYDGVHITRLNANRIIKGLRRNAAAAFKTPVPPKPTPSPTPSPTTSPSPSTSPAMSPSASPSSSSAPAR